MTKSIYLAIMLCLVTGSTWSQVYTERFRPQFHFSPKSGWIGDPTGAIKYDNTYRLFWWGQATSDDLVYWEELGWPMRGDDGSFAYFTGSVVVDHENTAGFNTDDTAMVAVYTMHNHNTGNQSQGISYSTDYNTFNYYSGNPVLDVSSTEFRDPQVFWHEPSEKWIMLITKSMDRTVEFYASDDLKSWTYLSTFGPLGARKEVWEVPDLVQLPLDGDQGNLKWVMICGMGPNKTQYYVGDFDGTQFTPDETTTQFLNTGYTTDGIIFEDFENGYGDWVVQGEAFGSAPATGTLPDQTPVSGYFGDHLINSYLGGDGSLGTLTSPEFTIEYPFINFLISGGNHLNGTEIALSVDGNIVKRTTGNNSEQLRLMSWDVRAYQSKNAKIVIKDAETGGWGHINIDHIEFSNINRNTQREHAYWLEWGHDYYAAKTFRNFDQDGDDRVVQIAWMNNWTYANSIKTDWGNSTCHSLPRELSLSSSTEQGYVLKQAPIPELQKLRLEVSEISGQEIDGSMAITEFQPRRNTYELKAVFQFDSESDADLGLKLVANGNLGLKIGLDLVNSQVYVDRTAANGIVPPTGFSERSIAPIDISEDSLITFHVFIDQLSVEVFVNDGELVFSELIFPGESSRGVEIYSIGGVSRLKSLQAWELKSIWGLEPTILKVEELKDTLIYPNPLHIGQSLTIDHSNSNQDYVVKLMTIGGQKLTETEVRSGSRKTIDINQPPGIYILKFTSAKDAFEKKLIIQ
ncbi:MAG: GH32 C-terminal domain-containing protein [Marinoscillum sp.]